MLRVLFAGAKVYSTKMIRLWTNGFGDSSRATLEAYSAYREKTMYGKTVSGVLGSTFVLLTRAARPPDLPQSRRFFGRTACVSGTSVRFGRPGLALCCADARRADERANGPHGARLWFRI